MMQPGNADTVDDIRILRQSTGSVSMGTAGDEDFLITQRLIAAKTGKAQNGNVRLDSVDDRKQGFSSVQHAPTKSKHGLQETNSQEVDILSKLPPVDRPITSCCRWNTNEEIASYLFAAQRHAEWCSLDVRIRPVNGSMLLYYKKGSNYKQDGYIWKKRKDGKLPREDHMRLKVKGVELIYANYVHSALIPTFHRRSYWLLSFPHIALVHYLNTPGECELSEKILPSLRTYGCQNTRVELLEQLTPMLCYGSITAEEKEDGIGDLSEAEISGMYEERLKWVNALIDQARQPKTTTAVIVGTTSSMAPHLLSLQQQQNLPGNGQNGTPALVLTTGGQLLVAIDSQSGALLTAGGTLTATVPTNRSPPVPLDACDAVSSSPSSSSPSAVGIQDVGTNEQESRIAAGIRSNSCSSASRRVMSSMFMRRQPSAFSDGADDVFRPLTDAIATVSSCTENLDDSAYCSFTDAKDEDAVSSGHWRSGSEQVRRMDDGLSTLFDERTSVTFSRNVGDPLLCGGDRRSAAVEADSANLGLSQEEIAATLKANLTNMIDRPPTDLFGALSPSRNSGSELRRVTGDDAGSFQMEAQGTLDDDVHVYLPHSNSPESSLHLLNQILNGDGDQTDECETSVDADENDKMEPSVFCDSSGLRTLDDSSRAASASSQSSIGFSRKSASRTLPHVSSEQRRNSVCAVVSNSSPISSTDACDGTGRRKLSSVGDNVVRQCHSMSVSGHAAVATITDFSPNWSYTQGRTKVLISGPWYSTSHEYNCVFGAVAVPATLIQAGVLRCFCPPHEAGIVALRICCDEQVISNTVVFVYRKSQSDDELSSQSAVKRDADSAPDTWISATEQQFCMGLLERLEALEKHLDCTSANFMSDAIHTESTCFSKYRTFFPAWDQLEDRFMTICQKMRQRDWLPDQKKLSVNHCGMTLLHFAAALGFVRLISVLFDWHRVRPSLLMDYELRSENQDANGRTPLMWACINGKADTAKILIKACFGCLFVADYLQPNELPLAAAFRLGHGDLVRDVAQQFAADVGNNLEDRNLDTAVWVLTSGMVDRSQLFTGSNAYEDIHFRKATMREQLSQPEIGRHWDAASTRQGKSRKLSKHLSLDSQANMRRDGVANAFQQHHQRLASGNVKQILTARERTKRASVEGLEELMRQTAADSENVVGNCDQSCESRRSISTCAGIALSSKITRQDSESSSCGSVMSMDDWLKQPLNVEIPMDIQVPDLPSNSAPWEGLRTNNVIENENVHAQMASLAQQIIDALPDRIKQETFVEEDNEALESNHPQMCSENRMETDECDCGTRPTGGLDQSFMNICPSTSKSLAADVHRSSSCRYVDVATPCSSSASPASTVGTLTTRTNRDNWCSRLDEKTRPESRCSSFDQSVSLSPIAVPHSTGQLSNEQASFAGSSCIQSASGSGIISASDMPMQQTAGVEAYKNKLGEFFNAARSRTPLECHFQELTLSDHEQRRLYEAAKVVQNAYYLFKQRSQRQSYSDLERQAAVVIQTCYRRYRQYCYYKKLHQAAVLIQKHFRLYQAAKRSRVMAGDVTADASVNALDSQMPMKEMEKSDENLTGFTEFLERAMQQTSQKCESDTQGMLNVNGYGTDSGLSSKPCIRIQVTPEQLLRWKQHLAAIRIQHAFRGHRKRQAAARKIQKFMREYRQKLRKLKGICYQANPPGTFVAATNGLNNHGQHYLEPGAMPLQQQTKANPTDPITTCQTGCDYTQINNVS